MSNYEIEELLAKYGGEADQNVERICGNCHLYNANLWTCEHTENAEDASIYKADKTGCYYHRTYEENERLKVLVKQRQDEASRLRLEEQRRTGTGDCKGCPFRKTHKEQLDKIWNFVKTIQDMRDTQKVCFKTHEILTKSKSLEAKVDVMADEMIDMIGDITEIE